MYCTSSEWRNDPTDYCSTSSKWYKFDPNSSFNVIYDALGAFDPTMDKYQSIWCEKEVNYNNPNFSEELNTTMWLAKSGAINSSNVSGFTYPHDFFVSKKAILYYMIKNRDWMEENNCNYFSYLTEEDIIDSTTSREESYLNRIKYTEYRGAGGFTGDSKLSDGTHVNYAPVIKLKKDVLIISGNGTLDNPYILNK